MCNRVSVGSTDPPEGDASYQAWTKFLDGEVAFAEEVTSKIARIGRVGRLAVFVLAGVFFAYFSSAWRRWRWLLTLAFMLAYYGLEHIWSVCQGFYRGGLKRKHFQSQSELQALLREFESSFSQWSQGRKFCVTENGYMGWVPAAAEVNDRIVLFRGCQIPFLLRPYRDGDKLIGDCYVHGFMEGLSTRVASTEATYKIH